MGLKKDEKDLADSFVRKGYVEFEVSGEIALFADPLISAGGEKTTYSVPTYEALKGITKNIYWKSTFIWLIDKVRIMKPIRTETIGTKLPRINGDGQDLANFTYLTDVNYQVMAHFEWNLNRPEYEHDRNKIKHFNVFAKSLLRGGRLPVFLGKSECCAEVRPCVFGEGKSTYDHTGNISFGNMYHGITYPDEADSEQTTGRLTLDYAPVVMKDGVIAFERPDQCMRKSIREGDMKQFYTKGDFNGVSL